MPSQGWSTAVMAASTNGQAERRHEATSVAADAEAQDGGAREAGEHQRQGGGTQPGAAGVVGGRGRDVRDGDRRLTALRLLLGREAAGELGEALGDRGPAATR